MTPFLRRIRRKVLGEGNEFEEKRKRREVFGKGNNISFTVDTKKGKGQFCLQRRKGSRKSIGDNNK